MPSSSTPSPRTKQPHHKHNALDGALNSRRHGARPSSPVPGCTPASRARPVVPGPSLSSRPTRTAAGSPLCPLLRLRLRSAPATSSAAAPPPSQGTVPGLTGSQARGSLSPSRHCTCVFLPTNNGAIQAGCTTARSRGRSGRQARFTPVLPATVAGSSLPPHARNSSPIIPTIFRDQQQQWRPSVTNGRSNVRRWREDRDETKRNVHP